MKNFTIKITDKNTNKLLESVEKESETKGKLNRIFSAKYRFNKNPVNIEITEVTPPPYGNNQSALFI